MKRKSSELRRFERDFVLVGGMSGDQRTVEHVEGVLRAAGIRCTYEGSVMYALYVERPHLGRAVALLRGESARGWSVHLDDKFNTA